jgi:hypothetical protein
VACLGKTDMSWGSGFGVVGFTTVMGGLAAFGLSYFLIWFLKITNFEGGAGYFTLSVTLIGVGCGFVVGLVTTLTMHSSFTAIQMRAAQIVVALTVVAGVSVVLATAFEDKGPKLEGDSVRLEVELKCPRDWKPDNALKAGHGGSRNTLRMGLTKPILTSAEVSPGTTRPHQASHGRSPA